MCCEPSGPRSSSYNFNSKGFGILRAMTASRAATCLALTISLSAILVMVNGWKFCRKLLRFSYAVLF